MIIRANIIPRHQVIQIKPFKYTILFNQVSPSYSYHPVTGGSKQKKSSPSTSNPAQSSTRLPATYTIQQSKDFNSKAYEFDIRRLTSAADYAANLCIAYSIPFAFMDAYCLKLRGHKRDTSDIDIAFGGNME